jgi:uncharacterized membrane protein
MSLRTAIILLISSSFLLGALAPAANSQAQAPAAKPAAGKPSPSSAAPASPQSTHFPILLLAFGNNPGWSLRIGQKGPERLDRSGYPSIPLTPAEVTHEAAVDSWNYHAVDAATSAGVAVHLTREPCVDPSSTTKYAFRASVDHAQLGTLQGCARIAAELFPKITNQTADDDDDAAKKKPPVDTVTNFKSPIDTAYVTAGGKVVLSHGAVKKIVAAEGSELALSHDGKKLLFTRSDSKTGPDRTIVLYDFDAGRSRDLVHGLVRQAFWSPDDSHVAYLQSQDEKWQVWTFPVAAPEKAASFSALPVVALHGWTDLHTLLASDMLSAYWLSDDKPQQTVALKEIYGSAFQIMSSDTLRVNPINSDLLLVSAGYEAASTGAPVDAGGIASGFFLYELRSKRRVVISPPDQWARAAVWSRDGIQIFYTRRVSATVSNTFRIFWDASAPRLYQSATDFVVGQ